MSQIVAASDQTPLLALLLKFDMTLVREILTQEEFQEHDGRSPGRGIAIGKTTLDVLQPCSRLLDLLDAPEDVPFMSKLIQREIVYRLLRGPQGGSSPRNRNGGRPKPEDGQGHRLAQDQLHETTARGRTRRGCSNGNVNTAPSLPCLNRDEPPSISKTASTGRRTRANAD